MTKYFVFTIDLERDVVGLSGDGLSGVDRGLPNLRDFFRSHGIKPDLFVSAELSVERQEVFKELCKDFNVGSHGYKHQHLLNRRAEAQREDIVKSTRVIEGLTGEKVRQFRAPNFSASGTTVAILEDLGYRVDSSVLPGRKMRHFGIFTLYDFRKAPRDIYHPSTMDITKRDGMDIVEIPPTENPLLRGAPLGMGFLNKFGIEKTQQAISEVGEEYVTFLIHSWEFVDLAKNERGSAKNLRELCKNNVTGLSSLLRFLDDSWRIVSLMELCEMWAGTQNEKTISG